MKWHCRHLTVFEYINWEIEMTKDEIVLAVEEYIKNEKVKYAFMISGSWGSGKTYLYENYLVDAISRIGTGKDKRKTNVYWQRLSRR